MLLTPEMCRAARALLKWEMHQLAAAAGMAVSAVERFEEGSMVEPTSVQMMLEALQGAGLEFIPAGGKSLDGGPGLRTIPMPEPEVAAAEAALELEEPVLGAPDAI
jgi:transcriptional regulator with XRE-family HTH domain